MIFPQLFFIKRNFFRILWRSHFIITIFLKKLAEKCYSTFNLDFFLLTVVDEFVVRRRQPAPTHHFVKTNNKCQKKKVQIKSWITSLGIVFQKNEKTKWFSELNNEKLLFQTFSLPLKYKLLYLRRGWLFLNSLKEHKKRQKNLQSGGIEKKNLHFFVFTLKMAFLDPMLTRCSNILNQHGLKIYADPAQPNQ